MKLLTRGLAFIALLAFCGLNLHAENFGPGTIGPVNVTDGLSHTIVADTTVESSTVPAVQASNVGTTLTLENPVVVNATGTLGLSALAAGKIGATGTTVTAAIGAVADNGGTISISNSTLHLTAGGLAAGGETSVGHIDVTNTDIVLNGPTLNGPHIGAQILNAGSTLTLHGGSISDITPGGGGGQSIGLRAEHNLNVLNPNPLIADGTNISGGFNKSAEATNSGDIRLSNLTITQNFPQDPSQHGALEVSGGSRITTDNVNITTSAFNEIGAFAQGGSILLQNSTITTTGEMGTGIHSEFASFGPEEGRPSTVTANNTTVTTRYWSLCH